MSTFLEKVLMKIRRDSGRNVASSQSVSLALEKHSKAGGVFLDAEKAFDAVWLDLLKYKLGTAEVDIPTKMIRLLS